MPSTGVLWRTQGRGCGRERVRYRDSGRGLPKLPSFTLGDPVLANEEHRAQSAGRGSGESFDRAVTRRGALQLALGTGAAAVAAPYLSRLDRGARAFDLRGARAIATQHPDWPAPRIVTRAQWGADESLRHVDPEFNSIVAKIIVHHTGTPNDITDYSGLVRSIFKSELNNGYIDVAYNWLIDPDGRIYEGRWAQSYADGTPHTGELDHRNVQGAHSLHYNVDTIGIGLMGDYSEIAPSAKMISALVTLLTWKCARWGIDPLGTAPYVTSQGVRVTGLANICGHRDTYATACPGATVESMLPSLRTQVAARVAVGATGYWIASSAGKVFAFGNLANAGSVRARALKAPIIGVCGRQTGRGYWLFGGDGGVFAFGDATFFGSAGGRRLNQPIVGMAPTPTGKGYWLVARDGGVFCFGDARYFGSTGAMKLNSPVLGLTPTSTGKGYWIYARDGGIFCFGDARFFGSTGAMRLNRPIVGMAARPQDDGYWMTATDGGIFTFGHATFHGSGASRPRPAETVSITASTTGLGYALLLADGWVLPFGDAPYLGSAVGRITGPAVGLAGRLAPL